MRSIPRLRPKKKAFTLIELIMTIIVVGIVAIPLSLLVNEHIESVFRSQDLTMAVQLARFEMEIVNNLAYAQLNSASFPNYQGYSYDVRRIVTFAQGRSGSAESLKKITVAVSRSGSANALTSLVTYIAKNVLYGI